MFRRDNNLPELSTSPSMASMGLAPNHRVLRPTPVQYTESDHRRIVDRLRSEGYIKTESVYQAMSNVNFYNFGWTYSYTDAKFVAAELENCAQVIHEGCNILVINSLYYLYIPLCLALMVGPTGSVVGHGDEGIEYVKKDHQYVLDSERLTLIRHEWDIFQEEGYPQGAPYDVILIHDRYFSSTIKDQLKVHGGFAFDQVKNKMVYKLE